MCIKCDQMSSNPATLTDAELQDHHVDLMLEVHDLAREISNHQRRIHLLTDRLEEVEFEIDERENPGSGPVN